MHIVAHRGYSALAPENTLPAFAAAVLGGATLIEFDVRTTADDVPVVIHDRTLDRTTSGSGHVWDLPYSEVAAADAGSWFSPAYAGTRVPTLAAVLELLADASLLLEIKPPATLPQVKTIVSLLDQYGLRERTIVQSFDPQIVRLVREVDPSVRRGLLRLRFEADTLDLADELDVVCLNPSTADVLGDPGTVTALVARGIDVMPWTANDIAEWGPLIRGGVAGLITDRVAELTGWLAH
ncbi:glycerophosphodiester phosphodiesterase [Paractinoplanes brasiliensis]|uniref:Glycerophosphoryl diester phosphodiesterase n=1 Tax=Paractinoplanes brasiliensis TaxID=52695 RepID=A0A4R6K0Z0_9ACTN|nr:glycerophosphodiester phosphodiesterase family protein [Actinoplanes brasiliensis]TDO40825.1 glycerophosphoryl diester phosphodiesterase [Actinoplanes brasiliensis]GID25894.1 glycerophosphoryl diester phosphodiesterase [Actinoplanes brasiliensis]